MSKITTIEKAIGQFSYRLQHGRYEPNQTDVEALKFIIEWINREKSRELKENVLFAKLFCRVFAQEVDYYKGDFKQAQKTMHEYLKHPIETYYDRFIKEIDLTAINSYADEIRLSGVPTYAKTELQSIEDKIKISTNERNIISVMNGHKPEGIYKSLNNTISEFINIYRGK